MIKIDATEKATHQDLEKPKKTAKIGSAGTILPPNAPFLRVIRVSGASGHYTEPPIDTILS